MRYPESFHKSFGLLLEETREVLSMDFEPTFAPASLHFSVQGDFAQGVEVNLWDFHRLWTPLQPLLAGGFSTRAVSDHLDYARPHDILPDKVVGNR